MSAAAAAVGVGMNIFLSSAGASTAITDILTTSHAENPCISSSASTGPRWCGETGGTHGGLGHRPGAQHPKVQRQTRR